MKEKTQKKEFYNKKARFDYAISDTFEVGIVLSGDEIKVIRSGRIDISTSYVKILNGELFWLGANFDLKEGDRQRTRKLLIHKEQIGKLIGKTSEKGATLLPLKLYITRGKAKLEVGLGTGLKKHDKRDKLKLKDIERDVENKVRGK